MRNCPFFGVSMHMITMVPVFMQNGGNQCALIWPNRHSPCMMEADGEDANWGHCPRNPMVNGTYIAPEIVMKEKRR